MTDYKKEWFAWVHDLSLEEKLELMVFLDRLESQREGRSCSDGPTQQDNVISGGGGTTAGLTG